MHGTSKWGVLVATALLAACGERPVAGEGPEAQNLGQVAQAAAASTEVVRNYKLPHHAGTSRYVSQSPHAYNPQIWNAVDISLSRGEDIVAMRDGVVSAIIDSYADYPPGTTCETTDCNASTNFVIVQHDDGNESSYLHVAQGSVTALGLRVGDRVCQGQVLGKVGLNGVTSGPHVHVSVQAGGSSGDRDSAWSAMWTKPTKVIAFDELGGPAQTGSTYTSQNALTCTSEEGRQFVGRDTDGRLEVFAKGSNGLLYRNAHQTVGGAWTGWLQATSGGVAGTAAVFPTADGRLTAVVRGTSGEPQRAAQWSAGGGWSGFTGMGSNMAGEPSLARNPDGRLEAFARGFDAAVWHAWQDGAGNWSAWYPLGSGSFAGDPVVGTNPDGRLEVFVRGTDGSAWHAWQQPTGGWSSFYSMGGALTRGIAVGTNPDGRLELFARGTGGDVLHAWQQPTGGWSAWYSLGGTIDSSPTVARNPDGRLEVFARGNDGAVWHAWQQPSGGWSSFYSMGGSIQGSLGVGTLPDGRLELFARGTGGDVLHAWQQVSSGWSAWSTLGTP